MAGVKVSLKVEYACRVMVQLARGQGREEMAHIEDLAAAEDIPANYLVQILNELRNSGLIVSRRGKQGGYALARVPGEVSLYDIVRAIDGEMLEMRPSDKGQSAPAVAEAWGQLSRLLQERARQVTLESLLPPKGEGSYEI